MAEEKEKKLKLRKGLYKDVLAFLTAIGITTFAVKTFSKQTREFETYKGTRDLADYEDFLEEHNIDYRNSYAEAQGDKVIIYVKTKGEHLITETNENTIDEIVNLYGMDKQEFLLINNLKENEPLKIWQKLKVYWCKKYEFTLEELDESSEFIYHKIMPGETLSSIAEQYNITEDSILKYNKKIEDRNEIQAHDIIKIKKIEKTKTNKIS